MVLSLTNCFESYTNTSSPSNYQLTGSKRPFSFIWHEPFGTNISSETPQMFINVSHSILSTRQYHVDVMNAYSIRYVQHNDFFLKLFCILIVFIKYYRYGSGFRLNKTENKVVSEKYPENCAVVPISIATYCDWALLVPCFYGNITILPRTIFVHHLMLPHFIHYVLPNIPSHHRFVLVSSGTDQTIPTSSGDIRFQPLHGFSNTSDGGINWKLLTNHPQLIHWFCENHDLSHNKVSTLPTGVVEHTNAMKHVSNTTILIPILDRPIQYLVLHRTRTGMGQWALRMQITLLCMKEYPDYNNKTHDFRHKNPYNSSIEYIKTHSNEKNPLCLLPNNTIHHDKRGGISQDIYMKLVQSVSFVLCIQGGGLDPSPKAWESLMLGTIPIIQHSTLDDAYKQFPVIFVKNWLELFIEDKEVVRHRLEVLRQKLAPYYINPLLRAQVVEVRD